MKRIILLYIIFLSVSSNAQDSKACSCYHIVKPPVYPKRAAENSISGKVVIELDVDSLSIFSNPVIKQGLGFGCDEEALKQVNRQIERYNECRRKCGYRGRCTPGKILQTV